MPAPDSRFVQDVLASCDVAGRSMERYVDTFQAFHALLDAGAYDEADRARHETLAHLDSYFDAMMAARKRVDAR